MVRPCTVPITLTIKWPGRVSVVAVRTEGVRQWGSDSKEGSGLKDGVRVGGAIIERLFVSILAVVA